MAKGPRDKLSDVKRVHRRFLYLDGDEVLSSLASLRGGEVTSVLQTSLKAAGGNAGIKFSLLGAGLNFGGMGRRETRQEVQLRQTVFSAVTVLLEQLYEQDGVGRLRDTTGLQREDENLVVQFEARIQLPDGWSPSERTLPWPSRLFKSTLEAQAQALAEASDDGMVATAELNPLPEGESDGAVLTLREKYLLVGPEDFGRRATVVGQVEVVTADEREHLALDHNASGDCVRLVSVDSVRPIESPSRNVGPRGNGDRITHGHSAEGASHLTPTSSVSTAAEVERTGIEATEGSPEGPPSEGESPPAPVLFDERILVRPFCIFR